MTQLTTTADSENHSRAPSRARGLAQAHAAAFLVGFPGLFSKLLDLSPGMLTFCRTTIGAIALLIFALGAHTSLRIQSRREILRLALSGAALAANWLAFFQAIQVSTVAVGLLAFSTFPLFVTFLEPLFFEEKLHWFDLATALAVIAGLAFIAPVFDLSNRLTQGVLWGMLCALACAALSLLGRSSVRSAPAVTVAFYQQTAAAIFTLPFGLAFHGRFTSRDTSLILLLGVVLTALPQALMVASLRHIRAQTASVIIALEPVYGIVFAIFLLHEIPSLRTIFGGLIICAAVAWASYRHANAHIRKPSS